MENKKIKYRIREVKFDDGRIEFIPEYKTMTLRGKIWIGLSDRFSKKFYSGYKSFEDALIKVDLHRGKEVTKSSNVVEEKIHRV